MCDPLGIPRGGTIRIRCGRRTAVFLAAAVLCALLLPSRSLAAKTDADCTHRPDAEFREMLEPIVEAVIDGRPAAWKAAARRAAAWWKVHRATVPDRDPADSALAAIGAAVNRGEGNEAARAAVAISVASLRWCDKPLSDGDRLMLLDLVGMSGWLRSRGVPLDWPRGAGAAADVLAGRLHRQGRGTLAGRLRSALVATLRLPVRADGDPRPARRLLDLVDVVEKSVR
jgi:hypothetical protein